MKLHTVESIAAELSLRPSPERLRVATVPTIPGRDDVAQHCLNSLRPQVDATVLLLNYADAPLPAWVDALQSSDRNLYVLHGDNRFGGTAKFCMSEHLAGWQFICDDDIVFPEDYTLRMIAACERYRRRAVITLHGSLVPKPICSDFLKEIVRVSGIARDQAVDAPVHVGGAGVMAFHSDTVRVPLSAFMEANVCDVQVSIYLHSRHIPLISLAHSGSWLKYQWGGMKGKRTLYDQRTKFNAVQVRLVNAAGPWHCWPVD